MQPAAAATVLACFDVTVSAASTLSLSEGGTPVAGTSALDSSTCSHGVKFTPVSALADGVYTASWDATSTAIPPENKTGSFSFQVDGTAPSAPAFAPDPAPVTSANSTAVSVSGTADPSHDATGTIEADIITASLTVTGTGHAPVTASGPVDTSGHFTLSNIDLSGFADGTLSYALKATDTAGNTSTVTTKSGLKDTVGPALASSVPAAGTAHQSTSTLSLTFNEALDTTASSATVSNKLGTPLAADPPVFSNGNKTLTLTTHSAMTELGSPYAVSYTANDVLENSHTGGFSFTIDDTAPATPTNLVATDPINSLNQTAVVVSGDAETGSTDAITLTDGTHSVHASTTADGNGHFQSAPIDVSGGNLTDGTIAVSVIATDGAGNASTAASTIVTKDVVIPTTPTAVTITPSPVNAAGTPSVTVSATVSGDTTNATISIDDADSNTPALTVTGVAPDGSQVVSHTFDVSSLSNGTLTASVVAFDASGNPSVAGTNTTTKDSSVPAAPMVTISPKPVNASTAGVTVSGTAEESSTVHISLNDADGGTDPLTHDVIANASTGAYTWTFSDLSTLHDGLLTATVTAEDAVHNVSSPGTDSTTMDRVAPDAPAITSAPAYANSSNLSAYPVSGTAESGATVTVTFTDSHSPTPQSLVKSTTADPDGNWSVAADLTSPALFDEGALHISATATDGVDNVSSATTISRTKDTTLPAAPRVDTWTDPINSGNVDSVAVTGTAGATENGAGVNVSIDDANPSTNPVTAHATADGTGAYSVGPIDVSGLDDGTLTFTVTATDVAGNTSATSTTETAAKDTTALAPVSHSPSTPTTQTPATVTATYNEPLDPSTSSITVTDSTSTDAAGATSYTDGGRTIVFTPTSAFTEPASPYNVTVVARDAAGDTTANVTFSFTVDNTPPAKPAISTMPSIVNAANATAIALTGTAENLSSIVVTISDGTNHVDAPATTNGSGAWSLPSVDVSSLADGTISATAIATDDAGNHSDASDPKTATKDTVVPAKPVVSALTSPITPANDTSVSVSGTAENGAAVAVDISDGTTHLTPSTTADSNGAWSISGVDVSSLSDGTISATAVATDAAGNASATSDAMTAEKRTVVPSAPQNLQATPGNGTLDLTWAAPASDGNSPVTSYTVTLTPQGGSALPSHSVSSPSDSFSGLTNGTPYTVAVTATNVAGTGPAATTTGTPRTTPGSPRSVTVSAGDGTLTVSWTAPAADGGDSVKSYRVTATPHGGGTSTAFTTADAATLLHKFSGLTNGTLYDVSVVANNAAGSSSPGTGSGTPKFVASLTIHDSAGHVVDGAKITLSGALKRSDGTGVPGATVAIMRAFDGKAPARLVTLTTSSTGAWSTTFAVGFNATYSAVYSGSGSVLAATSPKARTTVSPLIAIRSPLNKSTSSSSVALQITGRVAPNKAGRLVVLYYVTKTGRLVKLTTAKLSSKSMYVFTTHLKRGTWHLRVVIGASPGNTAASSSTLTVKRT